MKYPDIMVRDDQARFIHKGDGRYEIEKIPFQHVCSYEMLIDLGYRPIFIEDHGRDTTY